MDNIQKAIIQNARINEKENALIKAKIKADYEENTQEHTELSERIDGVDTRVDDVEQAIQDIELLEPQKGEKGDKGDTGEAGKDGLNGKDGKDGFDGIDGIDGKNGEDGKDGKDGLKGDKGDKPDHKWDGTKLAFEKPDGTLGKYVDLRGKTGGEMALIGSTGKMIEVQSDGSLITSSVKSINFAEGLKVTDNGLGYITVDADGSEIPFYWSRTGTTLSPKTAGDILNVGDGSKSAPSYSFSGDTDTGIYSSLDNNVQISCGGVEKWRISSATTYIDTQITRLSAGDELKISGRTADGSSSGGSVIINALTSLTTAGDKIVSFQNATVEKAYIDYTGGGYFAGNVGIGTTSPNAPLDIGGLMPTTYGANPMAIMTANVDDLRGLLLSNVNTGTSADTRMVLNDPTGHYFAFAQPGVNNTAAALFGMAKKSTDFLFNTGGTARDLAIGTVGSTNFVLGTSNLERIRITTAGLVGIGESSPSSALDIFGDINIQGQLKFESVDNPTNTMTYTLGGPGNVDDGVHRYKVMFTTADGDTALSADYLVVTVTDKATNGQVLLANIPVSTNSKVTGRRIFRGKIGVSTSSYYLVATINDNTTTTYTDNTADAGIGTADYRNIENVTSANIWRDGGKYGQIAANNFGLGYFCLGGSSTMTGWYNFALGRNVMRYCTTGTANVGVGQFALNDLTTGSYNVAIGTESLNTLATGSYAVAIGYNALYTATAAVGSIAISYQALRDATTATGMIALGYRSGYYPAGVLANKCTTSTYCTFIGYATGLGSTTQRTKSIAIGYNAVVDADNTCVIGGAGADAVDLKVTKRMIRSKSVYTGTDTTDNVYLNICDSATAFTLTVTDGTTDGEEMLIKNINTGLVTMSGKIGTYALSELNAGEDYAYHWSVSDDEWQ
jgi:hypothetical protein